MTLASEYIEDESQAPGMVLFGVPITPAVLGLVAAVLGVGLAGFAVYKLVLPAWQVRTSTQGEIAEKTENIAKQQEQLNRRAEAEANLQKAESRLDFVANFFPSAETLETLLFDANDIINRINAGITNQERKAQLLKFEPIVPTQTQTPGEDPTIVNDSSLGARVNGKLRRKQYKVEFEGTFSQTQAFLTSLERMQSLLVIRNLKAELVEKNRSIFVEVQPGGRYIPLRDQEPKLKTSFDLHALLPLTEKEKEETEAEQTPPPQ